MKTKRGFTLIELLVVISIIAVILGLSMSNLLGARSRARDAKLKSEMAELKNALRLYYNDYNTYPADSGGPVGNQINGCGGTHVASCPSAPCTTNEFSAGGTSGCDDSSVYMKRFPRKSTDDTAWSFNYFRSTGGDDFCLVADLENNGDQQINISQTRCTSACTISGTNRCTGTTKYCTCAD